MLSVTLYAGSLMWLGVLISLVMLQWLIANIAKAIQPNAVPGFPPSDSRAHKSFTFRAWRTHQNSLENISTMLGAAFFAILTGADPTWTQVCISIMVIARFAHTILYYSIATSKNPSPRSWFFMLGWLANLALILMGFLALTNS